MTRTTRRSRALAAVTGAAVVVPAVAALALSPVRASGPLTDVDPLSTALDGASAAVEVVPAADGTTIVTLHVRGMDRSLAGRTLGSHVHVGECATAASTAGHYKHGDGPVSPTTEVWLDFEVTAGGTGRSQAHVPFSIPEDGAASVVIHAGPTQPSGAAGTKLACLPVDL